MTKGLKAVVGANSDEAAEYGRYYRIKPWAERGSTMQQKIRNALSAFHTWRIEQGEDVGANPWEAPRAGCRDAPGLLGPSFKLKPVVAKLDAQRASNVPEGSQGAQTFLSDRHSFVRNSESPG